MIKAGIISTGGTQLSSNRLPKFLILSVIFLQFLVASCNPTGTPSVPTSPSITEPTSTTHPDPSQTPFSPPLTTPTPSVLHLWLSPALPEVLSQPFLDLAQIEGRPVVRVQDADAADVRLEPWPDVPLTQWIFALVTPFPTLIDGMSMEDLMAAWKGENPNIQNLYLPKAYGSAVDAIFETINPNKTTILEANDLIEHTWNDPAAIAIIPFESLEPRWKVLEVDGVSPIRNDFDPEDYPLSLTFGLSGNPEDVSVMMQAIQWPSSNRDPERLTVLLMTGVTALTRATAWTMERKGIEYPAEKIGSWLLEADVTHISNEVSFFDRCPAQTPVREVLSFCSDLDYIELLQAIDVDVIELTGNHLEDYGEEPFLTTLEMYRQNDWGVFGGGRNLEEALRPLLIEHNGNKLAFLGCNSVGPFSVLAKEASAGAAPCDYEILYPQLQHLRSEGYLPIFTFQWIEFYQAKPTTKQMEDFRAVIDAGAVIVSGSQAHQPQAMEFYGDGFIHYGLGNLFFDQMWAVEVRQEFLDRHVFYDGKHISTELLTAFLEDFAQPRPMASEERAIFLQEIFKASGW